MAGIIAAAAIGGIGALGSAFIGANASKHAADQQASEFQQGLTQQQYMFGQAKDALSPYYTAGQDVLPTLKALLTPGASQTSTLEQTPGFQFASQYGTKAATNALAASGKASGGPLATAISKFNSGLAAQNTFFPLVNSLQNFANTGANAASSLAGNAIASGNGQAQSYGNIGNAQAAGTLGSANALTGGIGGATGGISNALILNKLLGGGSFGLYGNAADAGIGNGVGTGGFNFMDAAAG